MPAEIVQKKKGFTIVEMVLYVSILAILLTVITNILFVIGKSYAGLKIQSQMATAAAVTFEKILAEGRLGSAINDGGSTFNSDEGVITLIRDTGVSVRFYTSDGRLYYEEGGVLIGPLTPQSVVVDSFFIQRIDGSTIDGLKANLTLSSQYKNLVYSKAFHVSAIMRN